MRFEYKDHILEIERKDVEGVPMYLGTCSKLNNITTWYDDYLIVIRSFVQEVDRKLPIEIEYKGYTLTVKKRLDKEGWYIGTCKVGTKEWEEQGTSIKNVVRGLEYHVDVYLKPEYSVVPTDENLDSYKGYELNIIKMEDFLDLGRDYYIGKSNDFSMEWRGDSLQEVKNKFRSHIDNNITEVRKPYGLQSYHNHLDELKVKSKTHSYSPKKIEHELKDIRDLYYEVLGFNFATVKNHYFERLENG